MIKQIEIDLNLQLLKMIEHHLILVKKYGVVMLEKELENHQQVIKYVKVMNGN